MLQVTFTLNLLISSLGKGLTKASQLSSFLRQGYQCSSKPNSDLYVKFDTFFSVTFFENYFIFH